MQFNEYQELAARTSKRLAKWEKIENGIYGCCGESGELIDHYKKAKFQGHSLDKDKLIKEAGDVLWYLSCLADGLGVSLEEIASQNIQKLLDRYPDGFDPNRSINREREK